MHLEMVGIFMPTIFVCMEVANTFIPTAGTVGLLPMVTYFFLFVAMFTCLGIFIVSITAPKTPYPEPVSPNYAQILTTIIATVTGLTYYLIQAHYRDILAEIATVSDPNDRQTLIREFYNAIGQYRFIAWFITTPLLLFQLISMLRLELGEIKRQLGGLLLACLFMVFASYIGHEQLSFDNEIQIAPKLTWGLIALIDYVSILFTIHRLWKQFESKAHAAFRPTALILAIVWAIYFAGYFLTLAPIDFNWIQLVFTLADVISVVGIGLILYLVNTNRWNTNL